MSEFREQVRAWLAANVPTPPLSSPGTPEGFAAHREWERTLAQAGYTGLSWPAEFGGRGLGVVEQAIFEEEYLLADGPERVGVIGQNLLGPTLIACGSDEQKARWLPGIVSGEVIWSQGFSEPNAGSDLAGIRTRAERDGDAWLVTGQKIWTSYGANADWIFVLARSDASAERHRGITFLCMPLDTPGVTVRPIVQLDGQAGFAEVFFDAARVPADNVVGEPGDGWRVSMTMLGFERDAPAKPAARYRRALQDLIALIAARGLSGDGAIRDRIAALWVGCDAYRAHTRRTLARLARGESLGPESSATKLLWSELERDLYDTYRDVLGAHGEEPGEWASDYWFARAATIYAGTSEIQRNIVAERVLGLPR